jgi:capsular polysaccharide biosynthesis protein
MNNNVSTVEHSTAPNPSSFFRILRKNLVLIILITVFCGLMGTMYSVLKVKPVYTASRSVMLKTSVKVDEVTPTVQGSVTLAKMYLHQVEKTMYSPNVIEEATKRYGVEKGRLSAGAVSVNYGSESLIFKVSYTAASEREAKEKLSSLIDAASIRLSDIIKANDVALVNVQNDADISVSSSFNKFIVLGVALGVILAVAVVMLKYALDNTVKSKAEYEYLTGVSVVAVIDKIDDKSNK